MHTNVENFDMLAHLVELSIKLRINPSGTTKVDQARAEGNHHGKIEMIAESIALILTGERAKMMQPLLVAEQRKWVEAVPNYLIRQYLIELKKRWDAKEFDGVSDEHFHIAVRGELNEKFLGGEWYEKNYEPQRRRAIQSGVVEPTEDDAAWILKELEALESIAAPARALARKVGLV